METNVSIPKWYTTHPDRMCPNNENEVPLVENMSQGTKDGRSLCSSSRSCQLPMGVRDHHQLPAWNHFLPNLLQDQCCFRHWVAKGNQKPSGAQIKTHGNRTIMYPFVLVQKYHQGVALFERPYNTPWSSKFTCAVTSHLQLQFLIWNGFYRKIILHSLLLAE